MRIFQNLWFVKAQLGDNAVVRSSKNRLPSFTRSSYLALLQEAPVAPAKDLFKTFEK